MFSFLSTMSLIIEYTPISYFEAHKGDEYYPHEHLEKQRIDPKSTI